MSAFLATKSPPRAPRSGGLRCWPLVAGAVIGSAVAGPARALALDAIVEQSSLGQPLRMVVPVVIQSGEELSGECFKVVPARPETADGVPEVHMARVAFEQSVGANRLVVTTGGAVNEPAMRITLQAGCDRTIRREYLLLFDPPPIEAPAVASSAAMASGTAETPMPATLRVAPARPDATPAPRKARSAAFAGTRATTTSPPARAERARLAISRTVTRSGPTGMGSAGGFSTLAKDAQEAALEEQEVVLRNRIAELSAQVERMQLERIAELSAAVERLQVEMRAAEAAQRAADEAAKAAPWAVFTRWWDEAWPFLVCLAAAGALFAGGLVWWRRRFAMRALPAGEAALMASVSDGMHVDTYLDESLLAGPKTAPRTVVPRRPFVQPDHVDTLPQFRGEHDDAFDHEMAARRARPAVKPRR